MPAKLPLCLTFTLIPVLAPAADDNQSPRFGIDDSALITGSRVLSPLAVDFLRLPQ